VKRVFESENFRLGLPFKAFRKIIKKNMIRLAMNLLDQAPIFRQIIKSKNKPRFLDKDVKSRQLTTTNLGGGQLPGLLKPFYFMLNFGTYSLVQDFVKFRDLINSLNRVSRSCEIGQI